MLTMSAATLRPNPDVRAPAVFVRRLGPHHFAHLRAVAEGLSITDCAKRYLGVEHGHQARAAHQQASDAVRAVARRRGESAWRLIGLRLHAGLPGPTGSPGSPGTGRPALEDFAAERGLDGFSEAEVLELYEEAWPADRRAARGQRLRERQLALLRRLERLAAETPLASDPVSGWFDDTTADKLIAAGAAQPAGAGTARCRRSEKPRRSTLPATQPRCYPGSPDQPGLGLHWRTRQRILMRPPPAPPHTYPISHPDHLPRPAPRSLAATQGGSVRTVRVYRREAMRRLLWLQYEYRGARLNQPSVNLCGDYMAFCRTSRPTRFCACELRPKRPAGRRFAGRCRTPAIARRSSSSPSYPPNCKTRNTFLPTHGCW